MLLGDLLEDVGVDDRGSETVYADTILGQFFAKAFGEANHAGFGGAVGAGSRIALLACDGGSVNDAPVLAFAHMRNHRTAANEYGMKVHIDDPPKFLHRIFPRFVYASSNACIVAENIDMSEFVDGGFRGGSHSVFIGKFNGLCIDRAIFTKTCFCLSCRRSIHIPDAHFGARLHQALTNGITNAAGTTGDNRISA